MTMNDYVLNSTPLKELYTHPNQPTDKDFNCETFKNIEYRHLSQYLISDYCKEILDIMYFYVREPLKHQYVFIKIQDLNIGDQTSGTGHWHLDSSLNPVEHYENYIFVTGLHNTTEFVETPLVMPHASSSVEFNRNINRMEYRDGLNKFNLNPLTIYRYNGSNVHRGRMVKVPEKRMLIRLSNTDAKLTVYK